MWNDLFMDILLVWRSNMAGLVF